MLKLLDTKGDAGLGCGGWADPGRIRRPFGEFLLTDLLLRARRWMDHSDATLLRQDSVLRLAVTEWRVEVPVRGPEGRRTPDGLASQPALSLFLATLADEENRAALWRALLALTKPRLGLCKGRWLAEAIVDMDSLPIEVDGHQPSTAYNGHYRLRCYHPLVAHLADGDFSEASSAKARPTPPTPARRLGCRSSRIWLSTISRSGSG